MFNTLHYHDLWIYQCTVEDQKFKFGVSLGPCINKLNIDKNFFGPNGMSPDSEYRLELHIGANADFYFNDDFYAPASLNLIQRRNAIATGGEVLVIDENGQLMIVKGEYYDFKVNQIQIKLGLGYKMTKNISLEFQPYFNYNISNHELKVDPVIDWMETTFFDYKTDYGLSGNLKVIFNRLFIRSGFDISLSNNQQLFLTDVNGLPIGKITARNSMFTLLFGYYI